MYNLQKLFRSYETSELKVVNTIKYEIEPDQPFEKYQTLLSAFMFPIAGEATIYLDDIKIKALPGKLIYIPHSSTIGFKVAEEKSYEYINVFHQFAERLHFEHNIQPIYSDVYKVLQNLLKLYSPTEAKDLIQKDINVQHLFHLLMGHEENHLTPATDQEVIESITSYIASNYDQDITLEKLASLAGKKESQISYLFKKYKNKRPIDYLIQYRLNKAMDLLKTTSMPINEIAAKVGYQDSFYFSRLFKKHTGYPPTAIRAQRKQLH